MLRWDYEQDAVLELRMEDFTPDPLNGWMRVFKHLGIVDENHHGKRAQLSYLLASSANVLKRHGKWPFGKRLPGLPAERLLGLVYNNRFETKTKGREAGKEDVKSHYRKGVSGDWANHFTQRHVDAFKERYNDLLVKLDYEDDADWGL
jgi:acetamidase/formamidase